MVVIGDLHLAAKLHQIQQVIIGSLGAKDHIMNKYQIVACPVANQHIAFAVQYFTPGRLDTGIGGKGFGVVRLAICFDDLFLIQLQRK